MEFDSPSTIFYNFALIRNLTCLSGMANWTAISKLQNLERIVCIFESFSRLSDTWHDLPITNAPRNESPSADLLSASKADLILVGGGTWRDLNGVEGFVYVSEQDGWAHPLNGQTARPAPGWRALQYISNWLIYSRPAIPDSPTNSDLSESESVY